MNTSNFNNIESKNRVNNTLPAWCKNGQHVLYVTERCVFKLGENGLVLTEVRKGVDVKKQILDLLPFRVEVAEDLLVY